MLGSMTGSIYTEKLVVAFIARASHCNGNSVYIFLFWELRGLSPNLHIHVSVSDLYIPRIGPHISSSRKGRPCTKLSCKTLFEMEDTAISILIIMSSPMFQISKPNLPTLSRPDEFCCVGLKMVAV